MAGPTDTLLALTFACFVLCCSLIYGQRTDSCNVTSVQIPDSNIQGGVFTPNTTNVTSCEAVCIRNDSCHGFDWDRLSNECYLMLSASSYVYYNNSPGVDHYIVMKDTNNCIGNCSYPSWIPLSSTHSFGAYPQSTNSLEDCVFRCIRDVNCFAFDWDQRNGLNCWIQNSSNFQTASGATGLYHYAKNCSPFTVRSTYQPTLFPLTTTIRINTHTPSVTALSSSSSTTALFLPSTVDTTSTSSGPTTITTSEERPTSTTTNISSRNVIGSSTENSAYSTNNTTTEDGGGNFTSWSDISTMENVLNGTSSHASTTKLVPLNIAYQDQEYEISWIVEISIKPTYVILAGIGGGCLLLVLTAVIILCQYPMRDPGNDANGSYRYGTAGSSESSFNLEPFERDDNSDFGTFGVHAPEFEAASVR